MFWMDLWTDKRFHLFSRQYLHTARAVSLCKLWFHIQDILLLCVFNWVCIVLAIPSSAALLHHIVLFCIIAWHIGVSYLFLTDVALLIVVALWSWGKHISIHCIHGQHKNGFRLKSNWLKYTIFPRPSFKSCFKKERICWPVQTHFKNMVAT